MALADALKRAADSGRKAAAAVAQRPTAVTYTVETWSAAVGTAGATLLSAPTSTLSPAPKVVFQGDQASLFGGGLYSGPDVALDAAEALIGPITPAYAGGGYDAQATFMPTLTDATQRAYLTLTGRGVAAGGERFVVTKILDTGPQSVWLRAVRTVQE